MIKDFFSSIKSYARSIKIIKELKLWKYFFVPIIIGFILGVIFIFGAFSLSDNIGNLISAWWKWEWGKEFIKNVSSVLGGLTIVLIGLIFYKHILMTLSAPFMSPVSEKVEAYILGVNRNNLQNNSSFLSQLKRSFRINISNLVKELLITLPLVLLSFIPIFLFIPTLLLFYFQSYFTGIGNLDYTLERHLNYSESKTFSKKHKGIAVGNGLIFTLMLFIPFFGIMIALPIATVASTIDSIEKLISEEKLVLINE